MAVFHAQPSSTTTIAVIGSKTTDHGVPYAQTYCGFQQRPSPAPWRRPVRVLGSDRWRDSWEQPPHLQLDAIDGLHRASRSSNHAGRQQPQACGGVIEGAAFAVP